MHSYGEYHDLRTVAIFELHSRLSLAYLERRFEMILRDSGIYDPEELELSVDLGHREGIVTYGVIRSRRGRIFELHILDHPGAENAALVGARGDTPPYVHRMSRETM